MKFKIRRVRLIFAYIIGTSAILILLIFLLWVISTRSLVSLGRYAELTNKTNIKQETYKLILQNTRVLAKNFNSTFSNAQYLSTILADLLNYSLREPASYKAMSADTGGMLNVVRKNNYLISQDKKLNTVFCYFGDSETLPPEISAEVKALEYNINLISLMYKHSIYNEIWVTILKDKFFIKSPDSYYEVTNTSRSNFSAYYKQYYDKYFTFYRKNPELRNLPIWAGPKSESLNKGKYISVECPILDVKGNIYGFAGIDLNIDKLFDTAWTSNLNLKNHNAEKTWRPFLLMDDTVIVNFPKSLYRDFGLPDNKVPKGYIRYDYTTKLSDSSNIEIAKLAYLFRQKKNGILNLTIGGKKYIISYVRIPVNNWIAGSIVSADKLYGAIARTNLQTSNIIKDQVIKFVSISLLFLLGSILLSVMFFKHLVLSPIIELKDVIKKIGKGNFNCEFKAKGITELVELSRGVKVLGQELVDFTENMKDEVKEKQALKTELNIAAKIQRSVLPETRLRFQRKEFDLDAKLVPSRIVSGDFYDFFYVNKNTLVMVLADVSGKGISAAFFMNMAKAVIKSIALKDKYNDPERIINKVNKELSNGNEACMFLTMYLLFYDIKTGKLKYANAGHHEILRINTDKQVSYFGALGDPALCLNPTANYKSGETVLNVGETIILCTDGVLEAANPDNEEYGEKKLAELVISNIDREAGQINNAILKDVVSFERGVRFDDITLLTLKREK